MENRVPVSVEADLQLVVLRRCAQCGAPRATATATACDKCGAELVKPQYVNVNAEVPLRPVERKLFGIGDALRRLANKL